MSATNTTAPTPIPSTPPQFIDVPKPLSPAQVRSYIDNGFLAIPSLITMAEVEELRADAIKLARGGYPCETLPPVPSGLSDKEVLQSILCIHQPHYISDVMLKYVKHPQICGVLSQIAAAHLPYWDGSVKCMQSMLFVKPPGFQGQAWHQDELYIPTRDRSLLGAWIALDDATVQNGCLYVIPGSHRNGYLHNQRPDVNTDEFQGLESFGFDDSAQVPVEVKAGSVVFFNGYLLHRSFKNRSDIYRRALVNHYMNAWSLLPWKFKDEQPPSRADCRTIVLVAGTDPYAWKGVEPPPSTDLRLRKCKANQPPPNPGA